MREIKRYKLPSAKQMNHRDEMYSMGNVVKKFSYLCMVTVGKQIYHSNHFESYGNIEPLSCVPRTNSVIGQLYFKTKVKVNSVVSNSLRPHGV